MVLPSLARMVVACLLLAALPLHAAITEGMPRAEVVARLGKFTNRASQGDREFLFYPEGVRIELRDGRVVGIRGTPREIGPGPKVPPAADPEAIVFPSATTPPPSPAGRAAPPPPSPASDLVLPPRDPLATGPDDPVTADGDDGVFPPAFEPPALPLPSFGPGPATFDPEDFLPVPEEPDAEARIMAYLVGVGLTFLTSLAAIKLALWYAEVPAYWDGIAAMAVVNTATIWGLRFAALSLWGTDNLFYVDRGLAILALIPAIRYFSVCRSLPRAMGAATMVQVADVIVALAATGFALAVFDGIAN